MKIGTLTDYVGRTLAEPVAPVSGVVTFIDAKGETIASIGVVATTTP